MREKIVFGATLQICMEAEESRQDSLNSFYTVYNTAKGLLTILMGVVRAVVF